MARDEWREHEEERELRRRQAAREDFGQADYSKDYAYDPQRRTGYRTGEGIRGHDEPGRADYSTDYAYDQTRGPARGYGGGDPASNPDGSQRSWMDRASGFLGGRPRQPDRAVEPRPPEPPPRRKGPSDRVLWAVIMERLDDARGIDLRNLEVTVVDAEVTLNGTVRHKADKRRIEDLVDIEGVRYVQNNLRPRDHDRHWTIL